jgi:multidrug resistance efflux pump
MRALVSRGLLLPPLVCGALVFGPVGTATAAVDADRIASDRTTPMPAAPEPDVDALLAGLDDLDDLDDAIDALLAKEEAEAEALVAKYEADLDALLAKLDLDTDALLSALEAGADDAEAEADAAADAADAETAIAALDAGRLDAAEEARHVKALEAANATVRQRLRKLDTRAPVTR